MKRNIFILFLIIYFVFFTPMVISDFMYGAFIDDVILTYKINNKYIRYVFDHKYFDGALMRNHIENDIMPYKYVHDVNQTFQKYQYIDSERIGNYSLFTSTISKLIFKMIQKQKRNLNISFIVSTRENNIYGNFLKYAYYTVLENDTLDEICLKHNDAILNVKTCFIKHTTVYDYLKLMSVDYIFNSWRALTTIEQNGVSLQRLPNMIITKKDIDNFISYYKRTFVILDFLDNNFIISSLNNI